jgi:Domain of unknown function (DUF4123)
VQSISALPAQQPERVLDTSDMLHRALARTATSGTAQSGASCWLLMDRSPLALSETDNADLSALLSHSALRTVTPLRRDFLPATFAPALLRLDSTQPQDSESIRQSLLLSQQELRSSLLAQGRGRVIAGWMECDDDAQPAEARLLRHFTEFMFFGRSDSRLQWFRWYDPAVLWALWPRLQAEQQAALLGPIRRFWLLSPNGSLQVLSTTRVAAAAVSASPLASDRLALTTLQWEEIDVIGALNQTLVQIGASEFEDRQLARASSVGLAALTRAARRGLNDQQDLASYARIAIVWHPAFDTHPEVAERLDALQPGEYFSGCVDDIDDVQWQRIGDELNQGALPDERSHHQAEIYANLNPKRDPAK